MKKIPLTRGKYALVDDQDFDKVNQYKWYYYPKTGPKIMEHAYSYRAKTALHKLIFETPKGKVIHHINGNNLDNRRENIVFLTKAEKEATKPPYSNSNSGIKGISWHKKNQVWRATIRVKQKQINLGNYQNLFHAADAYNKAALKYFGDFAYQNELIDTQAKRVYKKLRIFSKLKTIKNQRYGKTANKLRNEKITRRLEKKDTLAGPIEILREGDEKVANNKIQAKGINR